MDTKNRKWADINAPRLFNSARTDTLADFVGEDLAVRLEALLSEALDDTFPASDPVSSLHCD